MDEIPTGNIPLAELFVGKGAYIEKYAANLSKKDSAILEFLTRSFFPVTYSDPEDGYE